MPADDGGAAAIGAGVGKPPGKEPAKDGSGSGRECYGDLWVAQAVSAMCRGTVVEPFGLARGKIRLVGSASAVREEPDGCAIGLT